MNNDCCTIFWIDPNSLGDANNPPPDDPVTCTDCNCYCGYLQYESLLPYLPEIRDSLKDDVEKSEEFEFRLREQIIEISRLFDIEAGVSPGYFTKSHFATTRLFNTLNSGGRYLKIPEFVPGTLEVRTNNNFLLSDTSYTYENGFLIYRPCTDTGHRRKGCSLNCGSRRCDPIPIHWPPGCYKITARWGKNCADYAVQMSVRDYLIATYRMSDPLKVLSTGLTVLTGFKVPHAWSTYITNFKAKRALFSQFAFA